MRLERLWITEKPDMARNLAAGLCFAYGLEILNKSSMTSDGCLHLSNGDAVGFLHGHMLGLAPPEEYLTEAQSRGDPFAYLPLIFDKYVKLPKPERDSRAKDGKKSRATTAKPEPSRQLVRLVGLIKAAKQIVNAGDIDREGQLIVDELLIHAGVDPRGRDKPVWRLALQNPDEREIKKLLDAGLEKNSDPRWVRAFEAAYARETSDWSLGMTCSRLYRALTGYAKMTVGRIKTPVLALVVERERAIQQFKPTKYFVPVITLADGTKMRWFKREGAEGLPGFDEFGRITDERVAKQIVAAILGGHKGEISLAEAKKKVVMPPLPFSLGTLQSTVARRYGMNLKQVSAAAQALYEKHKMITYVGTDCQYLPTSMLDQAEDTIRSLGKIFVRQGSGADPELRSRAWNDVKVAEDEHFAIAPTGKIASGLTEDEKNVFSAISRRFLAQFYPNHEFTQMSLQAKFGLDSFRASTKEVLRRGWKDAEFDGDDEDEAEDAESPADTQNRNEVDTE